MYRVLTILIFIVAILLRLLLSWENPPDNAFDNHYEPISLILKTGNIPAKDACIQCYHPPIYYYSSALIVKTFEKLGLQYASIPKFLQLLNCLYAIATIIVLYLILTRLKLSSLSVLLTLSIICFLPRHIFMSAIHSNDSLTYLAISICVYLLLVTIDHELSWPFAGMLGIFTTVTIFVKYTAFIVLPMVAVPLITFAFVKSSITRTRSITALLMALLPPLFFLGIYMSHNLRDYGKTLPWNDNFINTSIVHPRDPGGISFVSFTPWQYVKEPIVIPGQMHSFWTLIYSGMWVDNEPKFTYYTDGSVWWARYYSWLRGEASFPSSVIPISGFTRLIAAGLLICGLIPIALMLIGLAQCICTIASRKKESITYEAIKLQAFPLILAFNAAGIMLITLKAPVYSSMKASYFLNSLPSFSVFLALGIQSIEKKPRAKSFVMTACCVIVLLSSLYVLRIVWALRMA